MVIINETLGDFELEAFHENEIKKLKLSDFKGKWVLLLFYPADFTFVCPTELEDAAHLYNEFKKIGCEILSISTDTVYAHKAWHTQSPAVSKVTFPMLADPAGAIAKMYGTYVEKEGLSLRASFIIDPQRVLRSYEMHDNSIGRNIKELLRKLQAAQYVATHKGQVCPANWEPGKTTLEPHIDLTGKL